jgi:aquaporin related protein
MILIGALTVARGALLIVVQTGATIAAAYMVSALFPAPLNVGTTLHPDVSLAQGVLVEMLLTSLLVFTILMLAAEQHEATFLAPVGIGLAAFIAHLIGEFLFCRNWNCQIIVISVTSISS